MGNIACKTVKLFYAALMVEEMKPVDTHLNPVVMHDVRAYSY